MNRTLMITATIAALALAGCASQTDTPTAPSSSTASTTKAVETTTVALAPPSLASEIYSVSPNGVTTAVAVPPDLEAAKIAEACATFLEWGITDAETMLAFVQATEEDSTEDVTITTTGDGSWTDSTPGQQSSVVAAVNAAATGSC